MNNMPTNDSPDLSDMLRALHPPIKHPSNFEHAFLQNLHTSIAQQKARQTYLSLWRERLADKLDAFTGWKWIYGGMSATTAAILAVLYLQPMATPDGNGIFGGDPTLPAIQPVSAETTLPNTPAPAEHEEAKKQEPAPAPVEVVF